MSEAKRQQFTVRGRKSEYDWRWPDGDPVWKTSYKDGTEWIDGELATEYRADFLECFGLNPQYFFDKSPHEVLREMSPKDLIALRRLFEREFGEPRLEVRNLAGRGNGKQFPAEEAL
ncbi:MAG: hypothetical protein Q8R25_01545 [bacterium]|nr:hypothetical protein [bacterium]